MRRLNTKLFVYLVVGSLVATLTTVAVHTLQASNIASALLWQAGQAEKEGRLEKAGRYLGRYLEFTPEDLDERAHLSNLLADPKVVTSQRAERRARFALEQVLTRDPSRHEQREILVRLALDTWQLELAAENLDYLQKNAPASGDIAGLFARYHELQGQDEQAAADYRAVIKSQPDNVESYVRLANLLRRSNHGKTSSHDEEIRQLAPLVYAKAPHDAGVLLLVAQQAENNDAAKARQLLAEGLERYPKDVRFYQNLARLEEERGSHKDAIAALEKGLANTGAEHRYVLCWLLANILLDDGKIDEARGYMSQINEITNRSIAFNYLEARCRMIQGMWHEAAQGLENVRPNLANVPDLAFQADLFLGSCYEHVQEPAKQLAVYQRALELQPESADALRGLASAQWALGRTDASLNVYRQNAALAQSGADAVCRRAELVRMLLLTQVQQKKTDWSALEKELGQLEKDHPEAVEPMLLRAEMAMARAQPVQAGEVLTKAVKAHPKRFEPWGALAYLAMRTGDSAGALKTLDEAEKQAGDCVDLRLVRARVLASLPGEQAVAALKKLETNSFDIEQRDRLWQGLGEAFFQANSPRDAERVWWQLAAEPRYSQDLRLRLLLFDLALSRGDDAAMEKTVTDIRRIEGADGVIGRYGEAVRKLWWAKQGRRDYLDEVRTLLARVATQRPDWEAVVLARAELEEAQGNTDLAIGYYRRALELGSRHPLVPRQLVYLLYQSQRFDEADQEIRRLQKTTNLSDDLQSVAIDLSVKQQDFGRAEQLVRQSLAAKGTDYRDHLWLGQLLFTSGKNAAEAEVELRKAVAVADSVPETWLGLVRFLIQTNRADQAHREMQQMEKSLPLAYRALTLAQCEEMLGDLSKARELYQQALESQSDNARVIRSAANFALRTGDLAKAEPLLRRLVMQNVAASQADSAWARRGLALVIVASGDPKKNRDALQLVGLNLDAKNNLIETRPSENLDEQLTRAKVLAMQNGRAMRLKAIAWLDELNARRFLGSEDRFLLAQLIAMTNADDASWGKSRDLLREVIQANPRHQRAMSYFINQLLVHNDITEADRLLPRLEQLERANKVAPGTYGYIELKARVLETAGRGPQALALLREWAAQKDAAPERLFQVAALQARLGQIKEAMDLCMDAKTSSETRCESALKILRMTQISAKDSGNMSAWNEQCIRLERILNDAADKSPSPVAFLRLADMYELLGRYEDVEKACRKVLAAQPGNVPALNNLAWLLGQRANQAEEGLTLINRAIDGAGPRPELLDTRGTIYMTLGKAPQAVADLEAANNEAPTANRLFHLTRAQRQANNLPLARETFARANSMGLSAQQLHPYEREAYRQVVTELK